MDLPIVIVSINLVAQTEEDYINLGLDVVYTGDRKELENAYSMHMANSNVLDKGKYDEAPTLAQFLEGVNAVIIDEVHSKQKQMYLKTINSKLKNVILVKGTVSNNLEFIR